jgi:hypothetical protein
MGSGRVYVMHNEWLRNPKDGNMPYKVGITKGSASDRYSGFKLLMPGDFIADFEYEFSENYDKVEKALHDMLDKSRIKGEWFDINERVLGGIRSNCELLGGRLVTDTVEKVIAGKDSDKPLPSEWTREMWIEKSKWTVEIADYLSDLIFRKDAFQLKYTLHYISFIPISSNKKCFFLPERSEKDASLFLINRDELRNILDKNNIHYEESKEKEAWLIASIHDKQFVEQHKDVFIKIANFLKDRIGR